MLAQVASFNLAGGPAVIDRYDRSRNVQIEVELSKLTLGSVTEAVKKTTEYSAATRWRKTSRNWRCRSHDRTFCQLWSCHAHWRTLHLHCASDFV